jgi:hypothetical protein
MESPWWVVKEDKQGNGDETEADKHACDEEGYVA